jgi:hypothetical protein
LAFRRRLVLRKGGVEFLFRLALVELAAIEIGNDRLNFLRRLAGGGGFPSSERVAALCRLVVRRVSASRGT